MRLALFVFCLVVSNFGFAQVNFSSGRFDQALKKAEAEQQLIFLQFESADCIQCNDVANKGFENKEVADKINQRFVCLKIDVQHHDRARIAQAYNIDINKGFGTLFIDHNGVIVHKFSRTTSQSSEYLNQADIAASKLAEADKGNQLETEYKKGNRDLGLLQTLMQRRKSLSLPTDLLLDEYVATLPDDSLQSIPTLVFIAQMAPLLDSKADTILRRDPLLFQKVWYSMNLQKRVEINNQVIVKSLTNAIKEKNELKAQQTAFFAQRTNANNYTAGIKAYDANMLRFYDETNDTTAYFKNAISFYEKYYLNANVDSVKRQDSLAVKRLTMSQAATKGTAMGVSTKRVVYSPIVQNYSNELNKGAYKLYVKTENPLLLSKATTWVEKALQFHTTPEILSTYAKLLYKQKKTTKAMEVLSEAIALQQKNGYPTKDYNLVLERMKTRKPLEN